MKGFLTALLVFASTGMVYAQQSQNDFSPRQPARQNVLAQNSGSSSKSNVSTRTNQTRLAALQNGSSVNNENDKYVIMDDAVDFSTGNDRQRPIYGPENDPRIRNAVQEKPLFAAQSSQRSATNVLPPRNNRAPDAGFQNTPNGGRQTTNVQYASSQTRPVSSIYDLQITPALENQLKREGFLRASLNTTEARSDQLRLFGDAQRARGNSNESKIFSSKISTDQGNLVVDIDDEALRRIEEGSYTLDDFNRYDARGVVLRYVSRNRENVDVSRSNQGRTDSYSSSNPDYTRREVAVNRQPQRTDSRTSSDYRNRGGDGDWVLPNSNDARQRDTRGDLVGQRDLGSTRTVDRNYNTSSSSRNYQDRMNDIYRDDTVYTRDRLVDRRYDDVTFGDRRTTNVPQRDVIDDSRRELDRGFAELSQWQRELATKTREIEEERRQLDRLEVRAEAYPARYETARNQRREYLPADLDRLRDYRSPVVTDRFADSRNYNVSNSALLPTLGNTLGNPLDSKFAPYAKSNLDQVARLNQKFAAMKQANELAALENKVDNEFQQQQLKLAQSKLKNSSNTPKTYIDDGEVKNTLGGNMAAGRGGYAGDRYAMNNRNDYGSGYRNESVAEMSLRSGRQNFGNNLGQQTATVGASEKLVRVLWFIALLSIGMNIYLALLARSFYSRYNELADELRETFTATI